MPARHDPFAALRQRGFLLYTLARFSAGMGSMLLAAAVFWQVYEITESAWNIALVGLVRFVPSFFLSLPGGAVADSFNRRRVTLAAQGIQLTAAAALIVPAANGVESLWLIYGAVFVFSAAAAFEFPARQSLLPMIVGQGTFQNAIQVSGAAQQLSFLSGPPLAGFLIAWEGVGLAYAALAVLIAISMTVIATIHLRWDRAPDKRAVSVAGVLEGVRFVRSQQPILGSMTLDMFAVIFGGAVSLLPIYAKEILDVGSIGYGFLYAAIDGGALLMSVVLIWRPPVVNTGRTLLLAVAGFGIATAIFGLSRSFPLSLVACACIGMSDEISVVMRQTTIQLMTPDALRGRVTSVNMLFIGASNQLGTVESGLVAALAGATFAVVSGGIGCLVALAAVAVALPEMRTFKLHARAVREPEPDAEPEPEPGERAPAIPGPAADGTAP